MLRPDPVVPPRTGPRPTTTPHVPHSQVDQLPTRGQGALLSRQLIDQLATLDNVLLGGSRRAPWGTVGLYIDPAHCFLLGHEFAHVHVEDDFSLHAILPEPLRTAAIDAGWAEPHPFAGQPTVSPDTVMIYAPRDAGEVAIVADLVWQSWKNAHE